jgi:hypothetical protein
MKQDKQTSQEKLAKTSQEKITNLDAAIEREQWELAESLQLFRSAVHHIAERESSRLPMPQWGSFWQRLRLAPGWPFGWALAAALCLSVLPFWMHSHGAVPKAATASVAVTHPAEFVSDEALLSQINDAVSQDVPDSLRPLAQLDSWSSSTQATQKQSEKNHAIQE